jgi:hypothetical protein
MPHCNGKGKFSLVPKHHVIKIYTGRNDKAVGGGWKWVASFTHRMFTCGETVLGTQRAGGGEGGSRAGLNVVG